MEFEKEELEIIKMSLEDKNRQLLEYTKQWKDLTWEDLKKIGTNENGMQEMYNSEKGFYDHKKMLLNEWQRQMNTIDKVVEKIFKEI